jgi:hypothetical protein
MSWPVIKFNDIQIIPSPYNDILTIVIEFLFPEQSFLSSDNKYRTRATSRTPFSAIHISKNKSKISFKQIHDIIMNLGYWLNNFVSLQEQFFIKNSCQFMELGQLRQPLIMIRSFMRYYCVLKIDITWIQTIFYVHKGS